MKKTTETMNRTPEVQMNPGAAQMAPGMDRRCEQAVREVQRMKVHAVSITSEGLALSGTYDPKDVRVLKK